MNNTNDISKELESMGSILAVMSRKMPYTVPDNYMQDFSTNLINTISSISEIELDANRNKRMPYLAPHGYFDQFAASLMDAVSVETILAGLPKGGTYTVPTGYFDKLAAQLLAVAKNAEPVKKETKQLSLRPKTLFVPTRWAAAAVMLICITLGSYITFFSPSKSGVPEKMLAAVPSTDIRDYFQRTYRLDPADIVGSTDLNNIQLDKKDIVRYLNENGWDVMD
jgi:hypothetical protein